MPLRTPCSLLFDPPGDGAWNMAVDESLLDAFAEGDRCCWRFYAWRVPTLSLGYFQSIKDRRLHPASMACPVVRRASGGGAILHDVELTYSFIAAAGSALAKQSSRLYDVVHKTLIITLAQLGVSDASLFGQPRGGTDDRLPFLCFERRSPGDVVYGGQTKIAGSAQRRRHGAVLQHGSVLLGRSAAAPELPGIADLTGRNVTPGELVEAWLPRLEEHLGLAFSNRALDDDQRRRAERYVEAKYASDAWTVHR